VVYKALDGLSERSQKFTIRNLVDKKLRSRINIPFKLTDKQNNVNIELEQRLLNRLERAGFQGIDGEHGAIRFNIGDDIEECDIQALTYFLDQFV
jgi:phosphoserine aminotransferase